MAEQKTQHITLHIYDTDIRVNVPAEHEAAYREAATFINERLNAYFGAYKGKKADKEIMYYAMIDIAVKCVAQSKRNDVGALEDILMSLTSEIEGALKG